MTKTIVRHKLIKRGAKVISINLDKRTALITGDKVVSADGRIYEMLNELDHGGTAIVYRANSDGSQLLLKELFTNEGYFRNDSGKIVPCDSSANSIPLVQYGAIID